MKIDFRQAQVGTLLKFLYQLKHSSNITGREAIQIEELINTIMFGNEFMDSDDKGEKKQYEEI